MTTIVRELLVHKGQRVYSVEPSATVREAVALLGEREIGAVLVCEAQHVVGVLTERDCMRQVLWQGRYTLDSPVRDVMRAEFTTVELSDSIQHCMSLMNDRRTRHLPVVEQGLVVGVISMGDVINGLLREQQYVIESLEGYISGSPSSRPLAQ
jgi:CBS domain-containing protein